MPCRYSVNDQIYCCLSCCYFFIPTFQQQMATSTKQCMKQCASVQKKVQRTIKQNEKNGFFLSGVKQINRGRDVQLTFQKNNEHDEVAKTFQSHFVFAAKIEVTKDIAIGDEAIANEIMIWLQKIMITKK